MKKLLVVLLAVLFVAPSVFAEGKNDVAVTVGAAYSTLTSSARPLEGVEYFRQLGDIGAGRFLLGVAYEQGGAYETKGITLKPRSLLVEGKIARRVGDEELFILVGVGAVKHSVSVENLPPQGVARAGTLLFGPGMLHFFTPHLFVGGELRVQYVGKSQTTNTRIGAYDLFTPAVKAGLRF